MFFWPQSTGYYEICNIYIILSKFAKMNLEKKVSYSLIAKIYPDNLKMMKGLYKSTKQIQFTVLLGGCVEYGLRIRSWSASASFLTIAVSHFFFILLCRADVRYGGIRYLPISWAVIRWFEQKMIDIRYFSHPMVTGKCNFW